VSSGDGTATGEEDHSIEERNFQRVDGGDTSGRPYVAQFKGGVKGGVEKSSEKSQKKEDFRTDK